MKELKDSVDAIGKFVNTEVSDIRAKMTEEKDQSGSRFVELAEKHDAMMSDLDKLHEKMDSVQTAMNRVSDTADQESKDSAEVKEYKEAWNEYLITGEKSVMKGLQRKALNIGNDVQGGFTAPEEMSDRLITKLFETSVVRQFATVDQIGKNERIYSVDKDEAGAEWLSELTDVTNADQPDFAEIVLQAHKIATQPSISTELLEDSNINISAWLGDKVADKFARTENAAFVNGDGVGKPRGFMTYVNGTAFDEVEQIDTGATTVINELDLIELMGALKSGYLVGASFGMSRQTNKAVRKLQDNNGQFIFGQQDLMGGTLYGYAVAKYDDMTNPTSGSTFAVGALPIVFGNMATAYTIVDRTGLSVVVDPFTSPSRVKYYTQRRVGAGILNGESLKILKIKA